MHKRVGQGALALALAGGCLLGAGPARAAAVSLLLNGSLEAPGPTLNSGGYCYEGIASPSLSCHGVPGWTGTFAVLRADSLAWGQPASLPGWDSSLGTLLMGLQTNNGALQHQASQQLNLASGLYTLSWSDTGRAGFDPSRYQVLLNSDVLGVYGTVGGASWGSHSLQFYLANAASVSLSLQGLSGSGPLGDGASFIDNLQLRLVAEPAGAALALMALLAAAVMQRRYPRA